MHFWLLPYLLFMIIVPYFCLKTAWTDPGILPRHTNPMLTVKADNPDEYDESGNVIGKLIFHHLNENFVVGKQVMVDGELITLKYCHTCEIFRPPRASHCHSCDNCVEEFDHHCPWVSNCVGRRNYRSFVLFVFSAAMAALYNSIFLGVFIKRSIKPQSLLSYLFTSRSVISVTFFFYTSMLALVLFHLFFYHLMLISYDTTTSEHVKKYKSNNKFSWSLCRSNFYRVFFHPVPEVQIPWEQYTHRAKHEEDSAV